MTNAKRRRQRKLAAKKAAIERRLENAVVINRGEQVLGRVNIAYELAERAPKRWPTACGVRAAGTSGVPLPRWTCAEVVRELIIRGVMQKRSGSKCRSALTLLRPPPETAEDPNINYLEGRSPFDIAMDA